MPKIVDHEQYSDELALKSFDIMAEDGIDRVSMRDLAKRLGVSTGVLYHYFSSKDDLLKRMSYVITQRNVVEVFSKINDKTPLEERLKILQDYMKENESYFQKMMMISMDYLQYGKRSKETLKILKESGDNYRIGISALLQVDQEHANFVHIFLAGLTYCELVLPGETSFQKQMKIFNKLFLPLLKPAKK